MSRLWGYVLVRSKCRVVRDRASGATKRESLIGISPTVARLYPLTSPTIDSPTWCLSNLILNITNPNPTLYIQSTTMGSVGSTNGTSLGPEFTQQVIDSMGPNTPPRLREIMTSFIRHMHGFARDVQLTSDEWLLGVNMINWAGQMSNEKRNEGQLMCDVIGLES